MALNRELLGKVYRSGEPEPVEAEAIAAYAAATNTDNPVYLDAAREGGVVAPPLFGVVASFEALKQPFVDAALGLDLKRLLHSVQAMRFLAPVRAGDVVSSDTRIAAFWDRRGGESVDLEARLLRGDEVVYEATVGLFVRNDPDDPTPPRPREQRSTPPRQVLPRAREGASQLVDSHTIVSADQSLRYADASGDHNPIHKDDDFARAAGLPGRILQGLCTMAMAQNGIIDALIRTDPSALRSLRGRFTRPVFMGDRLNTRGFEVERDDERVVLAYDVMNQDGKPVIKEGLAEVALS